MSRQSPKLAEHNFAVIKEDQAQGMSVSDIQAKTGYGPSTQRAVWRAATWDDYTRLKRARVLKRRTKATADRTRKRAAVRQQIIERNTKRKAVKIAVADQIESNRVYALEEQVSKLSKEFVTLRKRMKTLEDAELRFEAALDEIPEDAALDIDFDFLLAETRPSAYRRGWPWMRKRD